MSSYSIKELEKLTGIKAHTIRIWESRYAMIKPNRTDTNIRCYNDEQLKMLINIAILNRHGMKISKISKMSHDEINNTIKKLSLEECDQSASIDRLILSMTKLDESAFQNNISEHIRKSGFENTFINIVIPFLEKLGVMWQTSSISPLHEHFVSNIIRQKLIVAIDGVKTKASKKAKTFFLFLPEGEYHEFGLLFYYYLIKKEGHKVFYSGQSTPINDMRNISSQIKADVLLTSFVSSMADFDPKIYMQKLRDNFPDAQIIATGYLAKKIDISNQEYLFIPQGIEDFRKFIQINN